MIVGEINQELALGTLASNTLISTTFGASPEQENFLISCKMTISMENHTAGEGPLWIGVAHEDYTDSEIEATLEQTGSWNSPDLIAQELSKRKIRRIGILHGNDASEAMNQGMPIKTKCLWRNGEQDTLKGWVYNRSTDPMTTGTLVKFNGQAFLRPI